MLPNMSSISWIWKKPDMSASWGVDPVKVDMWWSVLAGLRRELLSASYGWLASCHTTAATAAAATAGAAAGAAAEVMLGIAASVAAGQWDVGDGHGCWVLVLLLAVLPPR
jgi:hypothetical protein